VTLTFDLILVSGQGIVIDYPCSNYGDFSFSRFDFIVRTDRHTDADDRYTNVTTVGVSNNNNNNNNISCGHKTYACNVREVERKSSESQRSKVKVIKRITENY